VKVNGFKKIRYGDLEPPIRAPIGESVKNGVTEPTFFVKKEPCGGI
jgi:hypothetical protein